MRILRRVFWPHERAEAERAGWRFVRVEHGGDHPIVRPYMVLMERAS